MKLRFSAFILTVAFGCVPAVMAADQYKIDPAHTNVGFSVQHLMISRVNGSFTDVAGTILHDPADVTKSSVEVTVKTNSITTNNTNRDNHLRSADFFDVEKFPEMTFRSTTIRKQGQGYLCVGTLTLHGVSKEVQIPFQIMGTVTDPLGEVRLGVEGQLSLDRKEFGINWNKVLDNGGVAVGNKVNMTLIVEAVKQ